MSNASCQDPLPVIEFTGFTPIGWQGAAQHTYTAACAGHHGPGPCPPEIPVLVLSQDWTGDEVEAFSAEWAAASARGFRS